MLLHRARADRGRPGQLAQVGGAGGAVLRGHRALHDGARLAVGLAAAGRAGPPAAACPRPGAPAGTVGRRGLPPGGQLGGDTAAGHCWEDSVALGRRAVSPTAGAHARRRRPSDRCSDREEQQCCGPSAEEAPSPGQVGGGGRAQVAGVGGGPGSLSPAPDRDVEGATFSHEALYHAILHLRPEASALASYLRGALRRLRHRAPAPMLCRSISRCRLVPRTSLFPCPLADGADPCTRWVNLIVAHSNWTTRRPGADTCFCWVSEPPLAAQVQLGSVPRWPTFWCMTAAPSPASARRLPITWPAWRRTRVPASRL